MNEKLFKKVEKIINWAESRANADFGNTFAMGSKDLASNQINLIDDLDFVDSSFFYQILQP